MPDLNELAKRFHTCEVADKSDFQRTARTLQSVWREEQGFEVGVYKTKSLERLLGSTLVMPWAEESLANYITDTVRRVVREEVMDKAKSRGKLFGRPRIFNNLLSSQPLCFNLFGELSQDLELATAVFKDITSGRVQSVTSIEFEESPGRGDSKYTGDNSAFDVFVTFNTAGGGDGFIGIEVKYHENLVGGAATHRPRYDEVADIMGCFDGEKLDRLKSQPLQQIWRDHLLAGALRSVGPYEDGFFVFLYPRDNPHCAGAITQYAECLTKRDTFEAWTLEDVTAGIKRHTGGDWVDAFYDRYLNFAKLEDVPARGPH